MDVFVSFRSRPFSPNTFYTKFSTNIVYKIKKCLHLCDWKLCLKLINETLEITFRDLHFIKMLTKRKDWFPKSLEAHMKALTNTNSCLITKTKKSKLKQKQIKKNIGFLGRLLIIIRIAARIFFLKMIIKNIYMSFSIITIHWNSEGKGGWGWD